MFRSASSWVSTGQAATRAAASQSTSRTKVRNCSVRACVWPPPQQHAFLVGAPSARCVDATPAAAAAVAKPHTHTKCTALVAECKQCCVPDEGDAAAVKYTKAVLEVCTFKLK